MVDSLITLGIGKLELDWSKSYLLSDFSKLFKDSDKRDLLCYYYDDYEEDYKTTFKSGYIKKLSQIKRRLDLLGYTLSSIKNMYEGVIINNNYISASSIKLSYEDFYSIFYNLDISKIDVAKDPFYNFGSFEFGEYAKYLFTENKALLDPIREKFGIDKNVIPYDLLWFIETLENLDPFVLLRILVENPQNADLEVYWFCPESLELDNLSFNVPDSDKIMIITEGTTDLGIIKRTIDTLYNDISDLFMYIDMEDNYPFTGNGSLRNFCIGLNRIRIQNNVIVLFDNDAAGCGSYYDVKDKCEDSNFLILKLPDFIEFNAVDTVGPQGVTKENINGRAVAIECFLDFNSVNIPTIIRWNNYVEKQKIYQGALENKEMYTKAFYSCCLTDGTYDTSKLKFLIDYILSSWINRSV